MEEKVKERAAELERKNSELETMIKGFVYRESRMAEMKEKIWQLEQRLASIERSGSAHPDSE